MRGGRAGPPARSLELEQHGALGDGRAGLDRQSGDHTGLVRGHRVLHLHGLEHDDQIALGDLLALLDRDLDHGALHRGGHRVAGGRGAAASASSPSAVNGSMVLSHSVSIQRVCTSNFSPSPTKAGSETIARWKGMTVASPSTLNSARARRERSSASSRVAPVTISLASIESNWPPITEPDSTPESTRTPGPDGAWNTVTGPGAGRKPRPASSPLMRNSKEWPRGAGSS